MPAELRVPALERGLEKVKVVRWLKAIGEPLSPGEDFMIVDTEPRLKLDVPRNAKLLSRTRLAGRPTGTRRVDIRVRLRLTAADSGVLREIHVTEGTVCDAGDLLGLVDTDEGKATKGLSTLRVVINEEGLSQGSEP